MNPADLGFLSWLILNRKKLKLTSHLTQAGIIPNFYQCFVKLSAGPGQYSLGSGGSSLPHQALIIAASEAIDRMMFMKRSAMTSSGFAVHTDPSAALLNARLELIERDAFLCHYLTQTPFSEIPVSKLKLSKVNLKDSLKMAKKAGLEIKFFRMETATLSYAVLAVVDGTKFRKPFGLKIAGGCSLDSLSHAAQSALIEINRNLLDEFSNFNYLGAKPLRINQFLKLKTFGSVSHISLGMDLTYSKQFKKIFLSNRKRSPKKPFLDISKIKAKKIKLMPPFTSSPATCYLASDDRLQGLFFGPTHPSVINQKRLKVFSSLSSKKSFLKLLRDLPHPFP